MRKGDVGFYFLFIFSLSFCTGCFPWKLDSKHE